MSEPAPGGHPLPPLDHRLGLMLLLVALALRLFHLGQSSFSTDEGWSLSVSASGGLLALERFLAEGGMAAPERLTLVLEATRQELTALLGALKERDYHPPLHYLLTWLAGQLGAHDEFTCRLPSAALGALGCWAAWGLAGTAAGPSAGLLAGSLAALSCAGVYHSQEVRMYAMAQALTTGAGWLWLRGLTQGRTTWCLGAGLLGWAGFLSHYLAGLFMPLAALSLLARSPSGPRLRPGRCLACLLGPGMLALPWLPVLAHQLAGRGEIGAAPPPEAALFGLFLMGAGLPVTGPPSLMPWTVGALLGLWLLGAWGLRGRPAGPLLLSCALLPPGLAWGCSQLLGVRGFAPHHFVIFSGFGWALAGAALHAPLKRLGPASRWAGALALAGLALVNLYGLSCWWGDRRLHRGSWREVAGFVAAHRRPDDLLILQTHYASYAYRRYDPEPLVALDGPEGLPPTWTRARRFWLVQNAAEVTDPGRTLERRLERLPTRLTRQTLFPALYPSEVVRVRLYERP